MTQKQRIIKEWEGNLRKSKIVDQKKLIIKREEVKKIFKKTKGKNSFQGFVNDKRYNIKKIGIAGTALVVNKYLDFIGIKIQEKNMLSYVGNSMLNLNQVLDNAYYIFKCYYSFYKAPLKLGVDIKDPFKWCKSQISFFASIEGVELKMSHINGESVSVKRKFSEDLDIPAEWQRLYRLIEKSIEHFLLHGNPGTGKTTFIEYFLKNTTKNCIVVGTTGIAAELIGGRTIHSFFELEPRIYLPADNQVKQFISGSKKVLTIKEADTVIIDEVSMLRPDILNAIDQSLRINTGRMDTPYGGKQIILIGDLLQLPPVLNDVIGFYKEYYLDEHFFRMLPFRRDELYNFFEFKTHFRQEEGEDLISILFHMRNNNITEEIVEKLNKRLIDKLPKRIDNETTILTTKREDAYKLNLEQLKKIESEEFIYKAEGAEKLKENSVYFFRKELHLKEGAPVIFTQNDKDKRWVNGSRGTIESLSEDTIRVRVGNGKIYDIKKVYMSESELKADKKTVITKHITTIKQYPIELAFAMTIHKSQGQTLKNIIIYKGESFFEPGLLYTALSRVRKLEDIRILKKELIINESENDFQMNMIAESFLKEVRVNSIRNIKYMEEVIPVI